LQKEPQNSQPQIAAQKKIQIPGRKSAPRTSYTIRDGWKRREGRPLEPRRPNESLQKNGLGTSNRPGGGTGKDCIRKPAKDDKSERKIPQPNNRSQLIPPVNEGDNWRITKGGGGGPQGELSRNFPRVRHQTSRPYEEKKEEPRATSRKGKRGRVSRRHLHAR